VRLGGMRLEGHRGDGSAAANGKDQSK